MIPTIDCCHIDHGALHDACRDFGFFMLTGHGIDPGLIEASLVLTDRFFEQPLAVKNRIRRSATNCWGFNDAELTKNRRDWKEILDIGPAVHEGPLKGASPQWPDIPGFRDTLSRLSDAMHETALWLVDEIAGSLGASIDLEEAFGAHSSFLRLNHYPRCPDPAEDTSQLVAPTGELGISHHSDAGAVTVLVQDGLPGLQVFHDGRWIDVASERGAVVINIGDVVGVVQRRLPRATAPRGGQFAGNAHQHPVLPEPRLCVHLCAARRATAVSADQLGRIPRATQRGRLRRPRRGDTDIRLRHPRYRPQTVSGGLHKKGRPTRAGQAERSPTTQRTWMEIRGSLAPTRRSAPSTDIQTRDPWKSSVKVNIFRFCSPPSFIAPVGHGCPVRLTLRVPDHVRMYRRKDAHEQAV